MTLTNQQIRQFRSRAHHLKPVVSIGEKGITKNLLAELERALEDHELIKVSIAGAAKTERVILTEELCQASHATLVQMIGRISVLYRPSKKLRQKAFKKLDQKASKQNARKKEVKPFLVSKGRSKNNLRKKNVS